MYPFHSLFQISQPPMMMMMTPRSSSAGRVICLQGWSANWHIPMRTVGNNTTRILAATLNTPTACLVSVVPRVVRSPPATTIKAPIPVSARAVHPHFMGISTPAAVFKYSPSISQTGKRNQGVRITRIPRSMRRTPVPRIILSEAIVHICCRRRIFISCVRNKNRADSHLLTAGHPNPCSYTRISGSIIGFRIPAQNQSLPHQEYRISEGDLPAVPAPCFKNWR